MDRTANRDQGRTGTWWRPLLSGILVATAAFALLGAIVTRYVDRNILNTQGYIAIVGPLPQGPSVAAALANFTAGKVFDAVDTQASIKQFLPPKLDGLAGPLSDTLQKKTTQVAQDFIKSDAFNAIWIAANQTMQRGVVRVAESKAPQGRLANAAGSLNLSALINGVSERVGGEAILTNQQVEQASTLRVDLQQRVDRLRTTVSAIKGGARALPFLTVALLLAALAVAYNRRHVLIAIGITVLLFSIATLIAFKVWSGSFLGNITNASYNAAATTIYEAFYSDLRLRLILAAVFGVALIVLAVIAGPYPWAGRLRHALAIDRFRYTPPYHWSTALRRWATRYEPWIDLAGLVAAVVWLLVLSILTPSMLVVIFSLLIILISLVRLIAQPAPNHA